MTNIKLILNIYYTIIELIKKFILYFIFDILMYSNNEIIAN